jgi:hypothetical protein
LLSSAFLIPEGAIVEVSVGVKDLADPGILLNARGKVLRVQPKDTGDFSVAIKLDAAFKLPRSKAASPFSSMAKKPAAVGARKSLAVALPWTNFVPAWHTET